MCVHYVRSETLCIKDENNFYVTAGMSATSSLPAFLRPPIGVRPGGVATNEAFTSQTATMWQIECAPTPAPYAVVSLCMLILSPPFTQIPTRQYPQSISRPSPAHAF